VLSPANKVRGSEGRKSFLTKKNEILAKDINWVEIDLLRAGDPSIVRDSLRDADYRVLVYRAGERRSTRCRPIRLRNRLPVVGIPLKGKDPAVPLDLGAVLNAAYESGAYEASIDYANPPAPPLRSEDARWANKLLRTAGLR
jgi:hypothetical protein